MVYRMNDWFIFEQGDVVMTLPNGRVGMVVQEETNQLNVAKKHQVVSLQFKNGKIESLDTHILELVRRVSPPQS
jgi:hypothetical protein